MLLIFIHNKIKIMKMIIHQQQFSFARRDPLGDVVTNSLKNSITRESSDKLLQDFGRGLKITSIDSTSGVSTLTFDREHGLSGIVTYSDFTGGNWFIKNGTYHNIKLFNSGTSTWDGATAKVNYCRWIYD